MLTTTASAVPHIKQGRARALCAAGGALAAALAWIVEVPLLGIHLNVRFGAGRVAGAAAGLRDDHLRRRRAYRDARERRGRRDPRPGAHGSDPLTAPGGG